LNGVKKPTAPLKQSGFLIIDKPANQSSAQVVGALKKILGVRKIGHTGTLDPFATGVLICCLNSATKLARFLLSGDKTYEAKLHLGVETDSQDVTGKITASQEVEKIEEKRLKELLERFTGKINQTPPVYSALKHKGVPLYKLARKGTPVQKAPRQVVIYGCKVIGIRAPMICLEIKCSAGTYIRTLAADIGKALGCGAHLNALRRIASSDFSISEALTLSEIEHLVHSQQIGEKLIKPAVALKDFPQWEADKILAQKIGHGQRISPIDMPSGTLDPEGYLKIVDPRGRLLAVLQYNKYYKRFDYCCVLNNE
jgi:tRNA pseudouridine55 synthase